MGTFFSTFQIKNTQSRPQFTKSFKDYMKDKGFVATKAKNPALSVALAFADGWVTVCPSHNDRGIKDTAQGLAKAMSTTCIGTSVYDSDCLFLHLYDAVTEREDSVSLGHEGYFEELSDLDEFGDFDDLDNGNPDSWTPLLVEGATWEQLTEVWSGDYVFIEEALAQMAPLLGMDARNVCMDYRFWEEEPDSPNIVTLYFRNADFDKNTQTGIFADEDSPTKLMFRSYPYYIVSDSECNTFTFQNTGGISRGLTIIAAGDCFEDDAVTIDEISARKLIPSYIVSNPEYLNEAFESFTAKSQKERASPDHKARLLFHFDDFIFPKGFDYLKGAESPGIGLRDYVVWIRFTAKVLSGSKHEISFHIAPKENWADGQCGVILRIYATEQSASEDIKGMQP
jgi:hypothetical protein